MDNEYLQNVLGSPYVNEGAFDRLKAKGAQSMGGIGAMSGYQIQNPTEMKLKSLWKGFIVSLNRVMMDWKSQVSPMLGPDVKLDATSRSLRKSLDTLAQTLSPYEVGAYSSRVKPNPAALKTAVKEGLWDAAKRNMGLNQALASNNPSAILNSYKSHVLSLFQNFMRDAVKSTGLTVQQIYKTLAKMQPNQKGWQAAGNMQKVVKQLQKLQGAPKAIPSIPPVIQPPTAQSPSTPPSLPPVAPQSSPTPLSSPVTPPQSNGSQQSPQPTQSAVTPTGASVASTPQSGMAAGDGFDIPAQDMPYVIIKALSIIIDAAKSDEKHALGLFGTTDPVTKVKSPLPPLLTKWGTGPALTASIEEATHPPKSNKPVPTTTDPDAEAKKAEDDKWKYMEFPGQFLYNFQSRYDKQPGQPFSIQVEPINVSAEIPEIGASVEVWWYNQKGLNKIYVVEIKGESKSKATLIAKFYDNEVAAKMGATTQGDPNFFTIEKVIQNANAGGQSKLTGIPPQLMQAIKKLEPEVVRAFMAVTHRKRMEFKSQGLDKKQEQERLATKIQTEMPNTNIDAKGTLTYTDSQTGQKITMTQDQMKQVLKGPLDPARELDKRLVDLGYYQKFPNVMPPPVEKTAIWKQVHNELVSKGYTSKKADKLIMDAWFHIKSKSPNASIWPEDTTLTAEELMMVVLKKKPEPETPETSVSKIPAALDSAKALMALGSKKDEAFNAIDKAVKVLGPNKTQEEYTKAALAKPKPTVTSQPNEPPKPVETPKPKPPQVPKFKEGDSIETGGTTFKIKSISPNNIVVVDAKGTEFAVPVAQWADWEKSGAVKPTKNPVSMAAGGAAPTTNPTAPVSNAGKEKAAGNQPPQDVGKLAVTNDGSKLVWTVGNDAQQLDVAQIKALIKKDAKFKAAVKANPDVYQKFKDMIDKGGKTGGKEPTKEGIEHINPFRWENFI